MKTIEAKKVCSTCGEEKTLPEFNRHKGRVDGRKHSCRVCTKLMAKHYRESEAGRVVKARCQRSYAKTPKGVITATKNTNAFRNNHAEKYKAHGIVNNALANGKLIRKPCEVCGETMMVQAHHDEYGKPFDIRWLCMKHHLELHGKTLHVPMEEIR